MPKPSEDKTKAVKIITECAIKYKNNLLNKSLLFVCMDKHKSIVIHEVSFEAGNYMHLTGCIPTIPVSKDENGNIVYGKRMSAPDFFWNCTKARISERDFDFSDNHTTPLKLEILPILMEKDASARQIGDYNQRGLVLDSTMIAGGVRACMGLKEIKGGRLIPNSALKADVRDYIVNPLRIIVTYQKNIGTDHYADIVHCAKNIEWDKIKLPTEYSYLPIPKTNKLNP